MGDFREMGKIEDIVKGNFYNEQHKLRVNIIYTSNWLLSEVKEFLKDYDITQQQFNILRILRGQCPNPITTSLIRERMLDKMSDVSRIVDRLAKKELVHKQSSQSDKRLVDVIITQNGLDLLDKIDQNILKLDAVMDNLTDDEAQALNYLLNKVRG